MFQPFNNNHQSTQVGNLVIENQTDKVIIYGDIDIHKSQLGLKQAQQLKNIFSDMVDQLTQIDELTEAPNKGNISSLKTHADTSSTNKSDSKQSPKNVHKINNPFA